MGATLGTFLNILIYIALVALGAFLGSRRLWGERVSRFLGRLQFFALIVLVLTLGVRLGADEQVISSLGQIGLAALLIAVFSMTGSLAAVSLLRRFILKLDRTGQPVGSLSSEPAESGSGGKAGDTLTKWIVAAVAAGMAVGRLILSGTDTTWCGTVINWGLYLILFLVGTDMGTQGSLIRDLKAAGGRAFLLPFSTALGTLLAAAFAGLFLPLSIRDTVAAAAGFGWYSLAPTLLAPYSLSVSAIAFLANVMREVFSIVAIPAVAGSVGYLESISLPGAAAMDTVLPVVVGATHERMTIYSFVSGFVLSLLVPVLVPVIIAL